MKIIDILNKIANGEEVKFRIIDEQEDYYCKKDDFLRQDRNNQEVDWWLDSLWLNKEVEIIEEQKEIPEKLETYKEIDDEDSYANILKVSKNGEYEIDEATSVIVDKINSIIDYLKSKGDE